MIAVWIILGLAAACLVAMVVSWALFAARQADKGYPRRRRGGRR